MPVAMPHTPFNLALIVRRRKPRAPGEFSRYERTVESGRSLSSFQHSAALSVEQTTAGNRFILDHIAVPKPNPNAFRDARVAAGGGEESRLYQIVGVVANTKIRKSSRRPHSDCIPGGNSRHGSRTRASDGNTEGRVGTLILAFVRRHAR
jgi:hypothetical protein